MVRDWLKDWCKYAVWSGAVLLATAGAGRAQTQHIPADVQARLEAQQREIDELKRIIQSGVRPATAEADPAAPKQMTDKQVQDIIKSYLTDHPGAGMPASVQTGFEYNKGFVIRSVDDPPYVKWEDQSKIPFELHIRGRMQNLYEFYKVTDNFNHLTGVRNAGGAATAADFSQLEVKRMRLIFEGTAYDPNLRYHIQLDGNTRGLTGVDNRTNFFANPIGNVQAGQGDTSVDHAVRLFSCYVAYDFHPCTSEKGCGPDCPEGTYKYQPTVTAFLGKAKPFFSYEEILGSANEQFVEYSMANWFFDADDDNLQMMAGFQFKALDDRLFVQAMVTNGNETQLPNLVMDNLPGIQLGGWYDFGGTWNAKRQRWDLYGDCISDIDYSCNPVVRVGGAMNLVPMGRRTLYTTAELDRVKAVPGAPGGSNLDSLLNGAGVAPATIPGTTPAITLAGLSPFAVDAFDSYTYEAFIAGKWHGFSIVNDWFLRNVDNFRGTKLANGTNRPILYTSNNAAGATSVSLFPEGVGVLDFGTTVQGGYFVIPKKLELCARYSWIRGQSGDINGNRTGSHTLTAAQIAAMGIPAGTTVTVVNGAFRNYAEAQELAFGVNYFFKRQLVKWQTDLSFYNGGNPAAGGQSPAGFIPGVDGWMVRSQIQFAF